MAEKLEETNLLALIKLLYEGNKDFYCIELATAGIMRNYMSRPCDMFFTMDMKVKNYLEKSLLLFRISDDKIEEVIKD